MNNRIKKASRHTNQSEGLIFEKSSPGKRAFELPPLDVPAADPAKALGANHRRAGVEGFPEVSEIEVIRHFTRLSTWNYAIDLGMYPLGSCTMKYNPRVNEFVARLDGIATEHPYQPQELSQGCLKIMRLLEKCLLEMTGMDAITLQPAAGAQGELTGLLLIRAYLEKQGNPRKKVLIPDSAHGTNPATAVIAGYEVENIRSESHGQIDVEKLRDLVTGEVAALMITNPSTLGIFEQRIPEIAQILHSKGALLYMDGANMNALTGVTRPGDLGVDVMHLNLHKTFSTPHGGGGPGARGAECELHSKAARGRFRFAVFPALDARSGVQRRYAEEKRCEHHGHCKTVDRLRLPSLHDGVSADCSWSHDDRADGIRVQGRVRPLYRGDEGHCGGSRDEAGNRKDRAAHHARPPLGRCRRRAQTSIALEAGSAAQRSRGLNEKDDRRTVKCPPRISFQAHIRFTARTF